MQLDLHAQRARTPAFPQLHLALYSSTTLDFFCAAYVPYTLAIGGFSYNLALLATTLHVGHAL